ncbi:hypothetical protein JCM3775_004816 [Rhodotorula graminis]
MSTITTTTRSATALAPRVPLTALPEGYASLFFAAAAPPPGKNAIARARGVPLETFIAIMHFVRDGSERDLVRATHVCTGWRRAIVECGHLWSDLDQVNVVDTVTVERVRVVAARAKDHLRRLALTFDVEDDPSLCLTIAVVVKQIFREVSRCGARGLEELTVDLRPIFHLLEDLEPAYNVVVLAVQFAEFSAVNLRTLKIFTALDRFPSGAPFLSSLPDLDKMVITSALNDPYGEMRLPDFFSIMPLESAQLTSCALTRLVLRGTSLMDSTFPDFPALREVKLLSVRICNLYGLLVRAPAIQTLWLRSVQTDPANRFLPPAPGGGPKDVPAPLELPALRHLCIAGESPLLWVPPTPTTSHFVVVTPFLETVDLGQQYDCERDEESGMLRVYLSTLHPTPDSLSTLFRNAPHLRKLRMTSHHSPLDILSPALRHAAPDTLTTLLIGGTSFATDALVDRLGLDVLPSLVWLDVFHPDGKEVNRVTVQALARLGERYKSVKVPALGGPNEGKNALTLVTNEPFTAADPSTSDLRAALRNLLLTLSPAQVSHLPSQLALNPPPGALSFPVIAHEINVMPLPPARPPFPLKPNGKSSAAGDPLDDPATAERKRRNAAAAAASAPRPVADQAMVDEAKRALQRWHVRREEEWALASCRRDDSGVELVWGVREYDDEGWACGKAHPGAAEWLKGAEDDD